MLKRLIIFPILKVLAKAVLYRYRPKIIAITGSVGKTSTKEAVYSVLKSKYKAARNVSNFNNEVGLPLTILGWHQSPKKNIFKWLGLLISSLALIVVKSKKYPELLILEMGADRPGDIKHLVSIARPNIAVITVIGRSHIEFFGTEDKIKKEKLSIMRRCCRDDWAVLNFDDPKQESALKNDKCQVITFGQKDGADVKFSNVKISRFNGSFGVSFDLEYKGEKENVLLPEVLGWPHAQAAAIAAAIGLAMGMKFERIITQLEKYQPARGRSRVLNGVKDTWIIDDSYNSSPRSCRAAIDDLIELPNKGRKIAVMGDMLELGPISETAHREIGMEIAKKGIDYLFVVGERSRDIARGAKRAGMSEDKIYHFSRTMEAGTFLQERMKPDDAVLVKGSRGVKMEQVVYEIMAKPWEASDVLTGPVTR